MSNVTALPTPPTPQARDAALAQVRMLTLRIIGAAMLPPALAIQDAQAVMLAHRLGNVSALADSMLQALALLQPPPATAPTEKINA